MPSAGLGTRLMPLTEAVAKPALPYLGIAALNYPLHWLTQAGITDIAVNAHYKPESITSIALAFKGESKEAKVHVSMETTLLGTGGAFKPLESWRENMNLMSYNPDIIADIDLLAAIARHEEAKPVATLVLLPQTRPGTPPVLVKNGLVVGLGKDQRAAKEAGIQKCYGAAIFILSKDFFKYLPATEVSSLTTGLEAVLADKGKIAAYFHHGHWTDFGESIQTYWECHFEILKKMSTQTLKRSGTTALQLQFGKSATLKPSALISDAAEVHETAEIMKHVMICDQVKVGKNAKLSNCMLLEGSVIADGEQIKNMIVTAKHRLPIQV